MKKILSVTLALTFILNQASAKCLANESKEPQKVERQVDMQAKETLPQSDEALQRVVDQVLVELQKREKLKAEGNNAEQ